MQRPADSTTPAGINFQLRSTTRSSMQLRVCPMITRVAWRGQDRRLGRSSRVGDADRGAVAQPFASSIG